jgi:hypothetical protein
MGPAVTIPHLEAARKALDDARGIPPGDEHIDRLIHALNRLTNIADDIGPAHGAWYLHEARQIERSWNRGTILKRAVHGVESLRRDLVEAAARCMTSTDLTKATQSSLSSTEYPVDKGTEWHAFDATEDT